jgi:hypothetical protein
VLTLHASLQVYGTSFWLLGADIVEALCDLTVSLVRLSRLQSRSRAP